MHYNFSYLNFTAILIINYILDKAIKDCRSGLILHELLLMEVEGLDGFCGGMRKGSDNRLGGDLD